MNEATDTEQAESRRLHDAAQIGREAEAFLDTKLGRWVVANAREQKQGVIEQLILVDPHDVKAVADLQGKAVLLGLFEEWLRHALVEGAQAAQLLKDYND